MDPTPTEAVQEPTSIPAPEPVSASTVDADAPASIEDTESDPPTPAPVPTVDAAADPLTEHLRSVQALVDEVIASAEPSVEAIESAPASEPATDDAWFF